MLRGNEVPGPDERDGAHRSDEGQDGADDEQDVEGAGEARVDGRDQWSSERFGHGVDGLAGVALLHGGHDPGQVPRGAGVPARAWPSLCWSEEAKIEP